MSLTFEPAAHRYEFNGTQVYSVTQVMESACGSQFWRVSPEVLERKRQIGSAAHFAIELDDAGKLDESTVHEAVRPYLDAWRRFRREYKFDVFMSEHQLYSECYGYAGTPDRGVWLPGGEPACIDFKTGLPGLLAGLQTSAYEKLMDGEYGIGPMRRFALQALPNGKYKFYEFSNPGDWRDYLACLAVHRLKQRLAA